MKERKQCFEKYVRSRADEERKERKLKQKEKKEEFKKLMEEIVSSERFAVFLFLCMLFLETTFAWQIFIAGLRTWNPMEASLWLKEWSYLCQSLLCMHSLYSP